MVLPAAATAASAATAALMGATRRSVAHLVRGVAGGVVALKMFAALAVFTPVPAIALGAAWLIVNTLLAALGRRGF